MGNDDRWAVLGGDQPGPDPSHVGGPAERGRVCRIPEAKPTQRGVVYTITPSYVDERTIWAGTDDGLIHVTRDGGRTWSDVTPPDLKPWMKVSLIDASHFDANEAFAAINTFRLDDLQPHIYRPTDGGRTWTHITNGIPDGGIINTVREDPKRRGLLFAGSEQAVCVSFDSGGRWQSLRLNMPATSIRDLVIKDDDLIAGTHGRSFWILDDITPLRRLPDTALGRATAVRAAGCDARALEHEHGYAAAAGRARRPEPARRRPPALLAGRGCAIRDRSRSPTAAGWSCGDTRAPIHLSPSWKGAIHPTTGFVRISHCGDPGPAPIRLGSPSRAAGRGRLQLPDRGDLEEHAAHATGLVGAARALQRAAHGRWPDARPH